MKIVVVLNSEPNSGKDTVAKYMHDAYGYTVKEMKNKLYHDVAEYYNVPVELIKMLHNDRLLKEKPNDFFAGKSPRDAMIHVAEKVIKPVHGVDHYAENIFHDILADKEHGFFVISDGGSPSEEEVINKYRLHEDLKIKTIYVDRRQNYQSNDVRRKFKQINATIDNNGTLQQLYEHIDNIVGIYS